MKAIVPCPRAHKRGTKATVLLADGLMGIAREIDASLEPKYNKYYRFDPVWD